jgi:hypothetical protein
LLAFGSRRGVSEIREDDQEQTPYVGIALEKKNARHVWIIGPMRQNAGFMS